MKTLLIFLFGLLVLAGCKKDRAEDPKPKAPVDAVAGQYALTAYSNGTQTLALPYTANGQTLSGTITAVAVAGQDAQANVTLTVKQTGQPDATDTFAGVQLQAASTGYTLLYNGQRAGTADGTTLTLTDGSATFTARK